MPKRTDAFATSGGVPGMFGNKRPDIVKSKKKTNLAVGPEKNINSPNQSKTLSIIKKARKRPK